MPVNYMDILGLYSLHLINNVRVFPLKPNIYLTISATRKACDVYHRNYWSHTTPEGKKFSAWIDESLYFYEYAGENIAKGYNSDDEAMKALMKSPTHKDNILNPRFKDVGIGKCGNIIVQHFGKLL